SVYHPGTELRIPLLLHAQVLVRLPGQGAGGLSGRIRHAGRVDGSADADADAEAGEEDGNRAVWVGVLARDHQLRCAGEARHDLAGRSEPISIRRYARASL